MSMPPQPPADAPESPAETLQCNVSTIGERAVPRTAAQRRWYRLLRLLGWDIEGCYPAVPKYVLVVAPHTSNWDFVYGFIVSRAIDLGFPHWLGKDALFRPPLGAVLRKLGGIPVDRRASQQYVDRVAADFARQPHFVLAITPEGTRGKTEYWKTGFYYMALRAGVPIVLGYLDYGRKLVGLGPVFVPTGDIEADFTMIRTFYGGIRGKHPDKQGEVRIRPRPPSTEE